MRKSFHCLLSIIFIPLLLTGKEKNHVLKGQLKVKGGESYPYQLVFSVAHAKMKGYSITKMPDGSETRTSIKGLINKERHLIIFAETKLLTAEQKDLTTCFVNAVLMYKLKGANYMVTGPFKGQDNEHNECGEGTVEFVQAAAEDDLFEADSLKELKPGKPAPEIASQEPTAGGDKITAGTDKAYQWQTDSCTIEIWDGGVIDGDVISVLVNGEKVLDNYTLRKDKKKLSFRLGKNANTISIIAEYEGINPPNTAQLLLYDGTVQYALTAFNKKGEKATVILKKK